MPPFTAKPHLRSIPLDPRARILSFDASGIGEIGYEDTEHYAVTRDFLNHYPRRLAQLLDDES
jgi:predicted ATPase